MAVMQWPDRPVEQQPGRFRPPHCPWRDCPEHTRLHGDYVGFRRYGSYVRQCDGRRVPRFLCARCGRTFSLQTFSCTYYLKRPELLSRIAAGLNAGSALRQLARTLGCGPSTATRLSARLGRHALLLQVAALETLSGVPEPVVLDHFETFAFSQNDPLGIATLVGQSSWFVYGLDPAPHRRSGTITPFQRKRLERRRGPSHPRRGFLHSCSRTLDLLGQLLGPEQTATLTSDGHPALRAALARHPLRRRVRHRVYPNPPRGPKGSPRSPRARQRDQAMFPVDLLHGLWRHSCAHHRRETIAFARRTNAALERGFLMAIWRNFVKGRSERKPDPTTPAMWLGLTPRPWSWSRVLAQRLFVDRLRLPRGWMKLYRRDWITPALGKNSRHQLKYAF